MNLEQIKKRSYKMQVEMQENIESVWTVYNFSETDLLKNTVRYRLNIRTFILQSCTLTLYVLIVLLIGVILLT